MVGGKYRTFIPRLTVVQVLAPDVGLAGVFAVEQVGHFAAGKSVLRLGGSSPLHKAALAFAGICGGVQVAAIGNLGIGPVHTCDASHIPAVRTALDGTHAVAAGDGAVVGSGDASYRFLAGDSTQIVAVFNPATHLIAMGNTARIVALGGQVG